ncbi:MAG TPA: MoaD/ThiS family protein [Chitinophagaceae bacterium]|nr:MoaD/ThiS family protein [Chitinophagaceae bacterium]
MKISILTFGIAKNIIGNSPFHVHDADEITVKQLVRLLEEKFPALGQLASFRIAVNSEFSNDEDVIKENDEIAIIPPVSGG